MKTLKTTVTYRVPCGLYCNHNMQRSTVTTRCRFCTEISRGRFVCVLHNEPLTTNGDLINKTRMCLAKARTVEDVPATPTIPPQDLMKQVVAKYQQVYTDLRKQGYPESIAATGAKDIILKGEF